MNDFPAGLVRDDLRDFTGYASARTSGPTDDAPRIWLNANESGTPSLVDPQGAVRRYPDPQPPDLVAALAAHYGVDAGRVVVGRGSDEAIELLVRSLCRPGADAVVVCSPTFGMYGVSARLHGVPVLDVPQRDTGTGFVTDPGAVARAALGSGARVVFLASPGNPTGAVVPLADLARLAAALSDQAVLVVDEAYQEFTEGPSATTLLAEHPTLVVLRTLSKAHALAAARVGVALAHPGLATVLRRVQAPYPVPVPVTRLALAALAPDAVRGTGHRVAQVRRDRERLADTLAADPRIRGVYRGQGNFVLARCTDADGVLADLRASGVVVRDLRHMVGLDDAVRVTVGAPEEVAAVGTALGTRLRGTGEPGPAPMTAPGTRT